VAQVAALEAPDVLVLGGGGILGEAWLTAVLVGLEDAAGIDMRECEGYVGTSAGSIVAAVLVAGIDPRSRLGDLPEQPPVEEPAADGDGGLLARALELGLAAGGSVGAPLAAIGLRSLDPAGALMRRAALGRMPTGTRSLARLGRELEGAGARWDGRLAVAAVEVESGRRVMFGQPGAPEAPVGAAVEASCAIPGFFRPIRLGDRNFVDGGVWSPTNLDAAPAGGGTRVLCLNPTGSMRAGRASALGALGLLSRSIAGVEALALRRRGARVTTVSPDDASISAIGPNLMDPRPRAQVIAAGLSQGRALAAA
jgi:NTE family protein